MDVPITSETTFEFFDDGYYFEIITIQDNIKSRANTVSGTRTVKYKNGDTVLWTVSLNASFIYTGSSATCTSSSVSTTCPSSAWKITNKSASKSENTATAKVTAKQYLAGISIQTVNKTVTLSCDDNGKLS